MRSFRTKSNAPLTKRLSDFSRKFPLTSLGLFFLILCLCFAFWGLPQKAVGTWLSDSAEESSINEITQLEADVKYAKGNPYFWGWSVAALSIWFISLLVSLVAFLAIRASVKSSRRALLESVADGTFRETEFRISPWFAFLPVRLSLEWRFPKLRETIGEVQLRGRREYVCFRRRARFEKIERKFLIQDFCGFFRFRSVIKEKKRIVFSSEPADIPNNFKLAQSRGEEDAQVGDLAGSYLDMRPYRPGDPIKHMLWKLWVKTNGKAKYVRTPDPVGDEKLAFFMFSHPRDEANARVLQKILSVRTNLLFGAGTMGGVLEDRCISENPQDSLDLLIQSGSWSIDDEKSCSYKSFLAAVTRRRIAEFWVFFPPGGEKEDALKVLLEDNPNGHPNYFVSCFEDLKGEKEAAARTVDFLHSVSPRSNVENYPINSGFSNI